MRRFWLVWICFAPVLLVAQTVITGNVSDEQGLPLEGVNVVLQGSDLGTVSDASGYFLLKVPAARSLKLRASFVGYEAVEKRLRPDGDTLQLDLVMLPEIINSEAVEITAELERRPQHIPVRMEVIRSSDIRNTAGQTIDQTLLTSPGVNVNRQFGMFSDKAVVSLRGQSGSEQGRTLVLVDGVPINKSDGGSVNWNFIRPEGVDHVEITKGPASARYGSSAMGGAINIVTSRPLHRFNVEAQAEAGQWNTFGGMFRVSGKSGDTTLHPFWYSLSGMARRSDGYINQPEETIILYDSVVVPSFLSEQAMQGRMGYQLSPGHQLDLDVNIYNDKRGRGIKIYEDDGSWSSHQTNFIRAGYNAREGSLILDANLYYLLENYYRVNEYFSEGEYILYDVDSRRTDLGGILQVTHPVGNRHEITAGAEVRRGSVSASDIYYTASDRIDNRGRMDLGALFVMDKMSLFGQRLQVNAGLRMDMARFTNGLYEIYDPSYSLEYLTNFRDTLMQDNSWMAINPKLSLNLILGAGFRTYLSAARGFRAPVLDDMCRSGRRKFGFRVANPQLGPEYINSFEWGIDRRFGSGWHAGISAFYSHGRDYMYAVSTGDSVNMGYTISPVYKVQNISGVSISGIEAELSGKISNNLSFFINYARNFTEITDFKPKTAADFNLNGKHLTDVPDHQANAGIGWEPGFVDVHIIGKYIGKRWINDRNIPDVTYLLAPQYPAYFNLDLKIRKQIMPHWQVSLSIENLFDEVHIDDRGQNTPGRFILGTLGWTLHGQ